MKKVVMKTTDEQGEDCISSSSTDCQETKSEISRRKWRKFGCLLDVAASAYKEYEEEERKGKSKEQNQNRPGSASASGAHDHHESNSNLFCRSEPASTTSPSRHHDPLLARVSDRKQKKRVTSCDRCGGSHEGTIAVRARDSGRVRDKIKIKYSRDRQVRGKSVANSDTDDLHSKKSVEFGASSPKKLLGDAMKIVFPKRKQTADGEWEAERARQKKKTKRDNNNNASHTRSPAWHQKFHQVYAKQELPDEVKAKIEEMNGSDIRLVIQKGLFSTDLRNSQNRLSIPSSQIKQGFLTGDEEIFFANNGEKTVKLIEPSLQVSEMILKRWGTSGGKTCFSYVLRTQWNSARDRNNLEEDDIIQLWSFRIPADELCLALVLAVKAPKVDQVRTTVLET